MTDPSVYRAAYTVRADTFPDVYRASVVAESEEEALALLDEEEGIEVHVIRRTMTPPASMQTSSRYIQKVLKA